MKEIVALIENNNLEEAVTLLLKKESQFYNNPEYWSVRGYVLTLFKEYLSAVDCFECSVKLGSVDCDMFYNYGYVCEELGYKVKAAINYALSCRYGIDDSIVLDLEKKYSNGADKSNIFNTCKIEYNDGINKIYCIVDLKSKDMSARHLYNKLIKSVSNLECIYSDENYSVDKLEGISLELLKRSNNIIPIIILSKESYVEQVRYLAEIGIKSCVIAVPKLNDFELVEVDVDAMNSIRNKEYLNTLSVCRRHASDGNVDAILRYIPEEMKKYKINHVDWNERFSTRNMVMVPLISSVTVNGFGVFSAYPKHKEVINIELWHAGLGVKAIGLLDKKTPNPNGWADIFKNVDIFCVPSEMNKVLYTSLFAIPGYKYKVTGLARNDMLIQDNARDRLEKLLGVNLRDKKIIFNLPTFHINENDGRIEGSEKLQDNFKIENFDYDRFDMFLEENNAICISKPHYSEENIVSNKNVNRRYKNTYFISNADLDKEHMNFYDVLGAGDLLITDYSSVIGDFIYMNKPIVYLISDIDEYRESKGFTLEPFDFWNPGDKVFTQLELEKAIENNLKNPLIYESERMRLLPVFYNKDIVNASYNVWQVIDSSFKKLLNEEK